MKLEINLSKSLTKKTWHITILPYLVFAKHFEGKIDIELGFLMWYIHIQIEL